MTLFEMLNLEGAQAGLSWETILNKRDNYRAAFDQWARRYRSRLTAENSDDDVRRLAMHAVNPKYVLRNYLAQTAIERAQAKDFSELARLHQVLQKPFDEQPEFAHYAALPPDWASHLEVSCSS